MPYDEHRQAGGDPATARLDDLGRLLSDWLWETDRDLNLTYIGPRVLDALLYHPSEFTGRPVSDLFGADLPVVNGSQGGRARPFREHEVRVAARSGQVRVLSVAGLPTFAERTGRFAGYRGVARDVTESKAQESRLHDAKAVADQANRAKSTFLATMSHEFRTPLNAVIGFADVLQGEYFGPLGHPKYREYAGDIGASARHLAQMIDDVLIERAVRMVKPRADADGLVLTVTYPTEGVVLHVDGAKIVQILVNLLANAVKFTEPGGTVDLAAVLTDDGSFAFTVADTGIGMREEDQAVALAPFGQLNAASPAGRQGSGLGLPIVKALIERHGGTLKIESEPGVGSALTVTLPATRVETLA